MAPLSVKPLLHPMTDKIIAAIRTAIKKYGYYAYSDRGPKEVMPFENLMVELNELTATECIQVLDELWTHSINRTAQQPDLGQLFVKKAIVAMQDVDDARWDALMDQKFLEDAYNE